jgi:hypothetical protein
LDDAMPDETISFLVATEGVDRKIIQELKEMQVKITF